MKPKRLVKLPQSERNDELTRLRNTQTEKITQIEKKVLDISPDLWLFLEEADDTIFGIADWQLYRRAAASTIKLEARNWSEIMKSVQKTTEKFVTTLDDDTRLELIKKILEKEGVPKITSSVFSTLFSMP
jgi:hypothetical protein